MARSESPGDGLRGFRALGEEVLRRARAEGISAEAAARAVAAGRRASFDRAKKAAQLARLLTAGDVERLLAACAARNRRTPSVAHARAVLPLGERAAMRRLLLRAAEAGWSAARLGREARRGEDAPRRRAGPRHRKPADLRELAEGLVRGCDAWLTRHERLWSQDACWPPRLGLGEDSPAEAAALLGELRKKLEAVAGSATELAARARKSATRLRRSP